MGYSARYHAASLAAVFLALAIGILIGVGFGDDVASGTRENLEESLIGDLEAARERADELQGELTRAEDFGEQVYPVLVDEQLEDRRIGVLAVGDLPDDLSADIETALEPAGGRLVEVAVVRQPPDVDALAAVLDETRLEEIDREEEAQEAFARGVGRQLVLGGTLLERVRSELLSRASGAFGPLDALVVVRQHPSELPAEGRNLASRLEAGILDGVTATAVPVVGVERSDDEQSSVGFLSSHDVTTVDNLDQAAGRVAMVFALLGAEGSFGIKETADRLLPDLLAPSEGRPPEPSPESPPRQPRRGPGFGASAPGGPPERR